MDKDTFHILNRQHLLLMSSRVQINVYNILILEKGNAQVERMQWLKSIQRGFHIYKEYIRAHLGCISVLKTTPLSSNA